MSLQATRRKHCDQAHPYQRNLKDGISLFGRDTPAYILEEVGRRQAADRGTSSLWAKLAADYGPKHANFIVKHDTKFPIPRNNRNSWSNIAHAYTDKKGVRPASAPNIKLERREVQQNIGADVDLAKNRLCSARARLADVSTRKDGPINIFRRTEELQVVVDVLQHTAVGRLQRKLKKGERKKAAAAAAAAAAVVAAATKNARRGFSGTDSIGSSSAEDLHSNTLPCAGENSTSPPPLSVLSSRDSHAVGDKCREASATSGSGQRQQWRRPKTARLRRRAPARSAVASIGRHRGSKTRPASAPVVPFSSSKSKRPRSANSGAQRRISTLARTNNRAADADGKLGMARARARIFSFGAGGGGRSGSGLREEICGATAVDAARRRHHLNLSRSIVGGDPQDEHLRGAGAAAVVGGAMLGGREKAVWSADVGEDESGDDCSAKHFGVVDISKLTNVLSYAEVSGHVCPTGATKSMACEPEDDNIDGTASVSLPKGWTDGDEACEGDEVAPTVPATSESSCSGTATPGSDGSDDDSGEGQEEEGNNLVGRDAEGGKETLGGDFGGIKWAARRSPGKGGDSSMPCARASRPDCLRGRYARAEATSRSAHVEKRKVTALTAGAKAPPTSCAADASYAVSATAACPRKTNYRKRDSAKNAPEGGGGRRRGEVTAMAWRNKLAAVQRRRAILEEAMRSEANRLVEACAERGGHVGWQGDKLNSAHCETEITHANQARSSCNASVSVSVCVRGVGGVLDSKARSDEGTRPLLKRKVEAAMMIQRAFRASRQRELWLGNQSDRDYASQVTPEENNVEDDGQGVIQDSTQRLQLPTGLGTEPSTSLLAASHPFKTWKLRRRHVAIRTKRMIRGFISCTQARFLLLQLLWDKTEGIILGERRSKRAAVESRAAVTIQQLSHIRRIAVGLIKMQSSAQSFKLEHQSRPAKRGTKTNPRGVRQNQGARNQGGGGCAFETAKEARSEKAECEAILREHGRRGRRLVDVAVRDRFLRDLLYSFRRQHITRDHSEYLLETSRPPFVDSRDVKRMLACPAEEMHLFSDPKNYRTRPRYTRLALPLREIEGRIQDTIASHVRSEYRDKLKETLGTTDGATAGGGRGEPERGVTNSSNAACAAPKLAAHAAAGFLIDDHRNPGGKHEISGHAGNPVAHQSLGHQHNRLQQAQTPAAEQGVTVNPNGRNKRRASVVFARGGATTSTSQTALSPWKHAPESATAAVSELVGRARAPAP